NLSVDDQKIERFGRRDVIVEVPYTLHENEQANQVIAYYLGEEGQLDIVKNARFDVNTGSVRFSPTHFSKYAPAYGSISFYDLGQAVWAESSIAYLASRGIISGVGNDAFDPTRHVTRAQFVQM